MTTIPAVAINRIAKAVPKFRKILVQARERDINESDTVTIVTDMLEEIFGFDKYSDITREYGIQGTYCDLAIKSRKKIEYLIEVKAIGLTLKDTHLRQAINYASHEGIKWVVLTNGIDWEIHRVNVDAKVESKKLFSLNLIELNPRKKEDQQLLFLLCKRGVEKDLIDELYEYRQSINRYSVGAVLLTDPVLSVIRRELRRIKTGLKVDTDEIRDMLESEVLKRDLIESDAAKEAQKQLKKTSKKRIRSKAKKRSVANNQPSEHDEKLD